MPNELTVTAVSGIASAGESHTEIKTKPFPQPAVSGQPYVNPSLHLDPALGLVVIEFRDEAGEVTASIPSQRQIDAYRQHAHPPAEFNVTPAVPGVPASDAAESPSDSSSHAGRGVRIGGTRGGLAEASADVFTASSPHQDAAAVVAQTSTASSAVNPSTDTGSGPVVPLKPRD